MTSVPSFEETNVDHSVLCTNAHAHFATFTAIFSAVQLPVEFLPQDVMSVTVRTVTWSPGAGGPSLQNKGVWLLSITNTPKYSSPYSKWVFRLVWAHASVVTSCVLADQNASARASEREIRFGLMSSRLARTLSTGRPLPQERASFEWKPLSCSITRQQKWVVSLHQIVRGAFIIQTRELHWACHRL